jgi:hypothetical protein
VKRRLSRPLLAKESEIHRLRPEGAHFTPVQRARNTAILAADPAATSQCPRIGTIDLLLPSEAGDAAAFALLRHLNRL